MFPHPKIYSTTESEFWLPDNEYYGVVLDCCFHSNLLLFRCTLIDKAAVFCHETIRIIAEMAAVSFEEKKRETNTIT